MEDISMNKLNKIESIIANMKIEIIKNKNRNRQSRRSVRLTALLGLPAREPPKTRTSFSGNPGRPPYCPKPHHPPRFLGAFCSFSCARRRPPPTDRRAHHLRPLRSLICGRGQGGMGESRGGHSPILNS